MSADVESDIAAYARQQKAEYQKRYRREHPETDRAYRDRHKQPATVTWTPPPTRTRPPDFRVALDARISVCRGCDQWCWDSKCNHCMTNYRSNAA